MSASPGSKGILEFDLISGPSALASSSAEQAHLPNVFCFGDPGFKTVWKCLRCQTETVTSEPPVGCRGGRTASPWPLQAAGHCGKGSQSEPNGAAGLSCRPCSETDVTFTRPPFLQGPVHGLGAGRASPGGPGLHCLFATT